MHARARRPPLAPLLRVLWLTAVIGAGAGLAAEPVRADGDPASDVLATQSLFLPWDAGVPAQQQAQLSGLLQAAERTGYPVRLAVVASPVDLGTVTELWHRPQLYAEFLAEELSLVYRGPLLVVMPNGFGLDHLGLSTTAIRSTLAGIPVPHTGSELARDAQIALERLAAATGHPLAAPSARVPLATPSDTTAWIVLLAGALLIALAWTASLRVRGLGTRPDETPPARGGAAAP